MKKIVIFVFLLIFLFSFAFSTTNTSLKFYPYLGYVKFHDAINLKNNLVLGAGFNKPLTDTLRIDLSLGYIPSEYLSSGASVSILYGSLNGMYLLPKACCNVFPFLSAGVSVFSYDKNIDKGLEIGLGILSISQKKVEHKFDLKARYNPNNKQSDIIAMFSLGLIPLEKKEKEAVVEAKKEEVKEIIEEVIEEPVEEPVKEPVVALVATEEVKIIKEKAEPKIPKKVFVKDNKITLDRFFYNSSFIGEPGLQTTEKASVILKENKEYKVLLTGFANNFETDSNSLALQRAEKVKEILVNQYSIPIQKIQTKSGGTKGVTNNNYLNRRVEIEFYYEE